MAALWSWLVWKIKMVHQDANWFSITVPKSLLVTLIIHNKMAPLVSCDGSRQWWFVLLVVRCAMSIILYIAVCVGFVADLHDVISPWNNSVWILNFEAGILFGVKGAWQRIWGKLGSGAMRDTWGENVWDDAIDLFKRKTLTSLLLYLKLIKFM